ncbi:MAG: AAA family ATPase [Clostridiales bacterium]|nr:AAA family ATPase [Clostridiales bacterium]
MRKKPIVPGKTLVIFDEIQACPKAITSLKYFCENKRELHMICAGSLLGVSIRRDGIPEVLSSLRNRGGQTAVVSNKIDFAVQQLCVQYFDGLFDMAVGEREGVRKKPAPDAIYAVLGFMPVFLPSHFPPAH